MRVECHSFEEFVECLESEKQVFQDTIRVSITYTPHEGSLRYATKLQVFLQASAVVIVEEGASEYILEYGEDCGRDIKDSEPALDGTEMAQAIKAKITEYAKGRGWRILPGVLSM